MSKASSTLREGIREFLLLRNAEERSRALDDHKRAALKAYYHAGVRRLQVARDLLGAAQVPVAMATCRDAVPLLASAVLLSRNTQLDLSSMRADATFSEIEDALRSERLEPPVEFDRVRWAVANSDVLLFDRLPADEAESKARELELFTTWLSSLVDPRSVREIKVARVLRLATLAISSTVFLVFLTIWAFSPANIALRKPATSSSKAYGTSAQGAVDGMRGQYDFHSETEDAPWLAIDLGSKYAIKRIKVYGRSDGFNDQSIPLALEVSDDGTTFREIAQRTEAFSDFNPWVFKARSLVTRFIRLRTKKHSVLVFNEVEVNGKPAP
jgi:hypothetical protein